ncbi:hypothetical protein BHE90_017215, partial [Fusarium euwallaceae]
MANENAAQAIKILGDKLNTAGKRIQQSITEIKNNTDTVQAVNTAAKEALEASKIMSKRVRDMKAQGQMKQDNIMHIFA